MSELIDRTESPLYAAIAICALLTVSFLAAYSGQEPTPQPYFAQAASREVFGGPMSVTEIAELGKMVAELGKMVGLVVAGVWAAWTFYRLQKTRAAELGNNKTLVETEKARAETEKTRLEIEKNRAQMEKDRFEIEKTRTDIQKSQIEQAEIEERIRRQQPQLDIQLEISEESSSDPRYQTVLSIAVVLKNQGDQNLSVSFGESLTIGRIGFDEGGNEEVSSAIRVAPKFFEDGSSVLTKIPYRILRIGQARRTALTLVPVTGPGMYLIQFSADYARAELTERNAGAAAPPNLVINAVEQKFFIARGAAAPVPPSSVAHQ
jgi:hypothetical protein